jgi:hypothetical protein
MERMYKSLYLFLFTSISLYIYFIFISLYEYIGLMVIDNINAIAQAMDRHPSAFFVTLGIDIYICIFMISYI